jgi:hypothetical protein
MALTMSLIERVRVQRRIAEARASEPPVPWATLSQTEQVPERTLRHMHREWLKVRQFYDDPLRIVDEALDTFTALIEEAARDIENAPPGNAKVGAMRVLLDLIVKRINLLVQIDRMPQDIGNYRDFPKVRQMILDMGGVLEKHDVGVEAIDDMLAIVKRADTQAGANGVALSKRRQ